MHRFSAFGVALLASVSVGVPVAKATDDSRADRLPPASVGAADDPIAAELAGSEVFAADFGVKCDSNPATDDGPALNAALKAIKSAHANGLHSTVLRLPRTSSLANITAPPHDGREQPFCSVKTTIRADDWSNIDLEGAGGGTFGYGGTRLKWTGASGGRMLDWSSPAYLTVGAVIGRLWLDGAGIAAYGITTNGLSASRVQDIVITNPTVAAFVADTAKNPGGVTLGRYAAGAGYRDGTHGRVALGSGVEATVVVTGGAVSSVLVTARGSGVPVDAVLTDVDGALGPGAGFALTVDDTDAMKRVGSVTGISIVSKGSGLKDGTYRRVRLIAGANPTAGEATPAGGAMLTADITVAGGMVTGVTAPRSSSDWPGWTTLTPPVSALGGTGTAPVLQVHDTSGAVSASDFAHNVVDGLRILENTAASANADGLVLGTGSPWLDVNTTRWNVYVHYQNGRGVVCGNADSNHFDFLQSDSSSASAQPGLVLYGGPQPGPVLQSCRSNHFGTMQTLKGTHASLLGNGDSPYGNTAENYLFQSGAAAPSFGPGVSPKAFAYGDDVGTFVGPNYKLGGGSDAGFEFYAHAKSINIAKFGSGSATPPIFFMEGPRQGWNAKWNGNAAFTTNNAGFAAYDEFSPTTGAFTRYMSVAPLPAGEAAAFTVARRDTSAGSTLGVASPGAPGGSRLVGGVYFDTQLLKYQWWDGTQMNDLGAPAPRKIAQLPKCAAALFGSKYVVTDAAFPTYLGALAGGGTTYATALCRPPGDWIAD